MTVETQMRELETRCVLANPDLGAVKITVFDEVVQMRFSNDRVEEFPAHVVSVVELRGQRLVIDWAGSTVTLLLPSAAHVEKLASAIEETRSGGSPEWHDDDVRLARLGLLLPTPV
jgi:hypothetical protein